MAKKSPTRGERNNNPLNIRHVPGMTWKGEMLPDNDRFCRFTNMTFGVRAAFALMRTYNLRYNIVTIRGIIERWAPPTENAVSYTHLTLPTKSLV